MSGLGHMTGLPVGFGALILHLVRINCAHVRADELVVLALCMLRYGLTGVNGFSGWLLPEKSVSLVHIVF